MFFSLTELGDHLKDAECLIPLFTCAGMVT